MDEPSQALVQLVTSLGLLLGWLAEFLARWLLLLVWVVWWLWGVNWRRTWAVLAEGAWVAVLLAMIVGALVWASFAPSDYNVAGWFTLPNFWWQLGGVGLLVALTLFCGWLQGLCGWTPAEIDLEPPPATPPAHAAGHH